MESFLRRTTVCGKPDRSAFKNAHQVSEGG
jgi:hypothetical protein